MTELSPSAEADQLIQQTARASWKAYWLDAALVGALLLCGVAVGRAFTLPCTALVTTSELRKGEPLTGRHLAWAPLEVSARNVTSADNIGGLRAARDLERGQLVRWQDVVRARGTGTPGQMELPLKVFVGRTPPRAGDDVQLAFAGLPGTEAAIVNARVLTIDVTEDPAVLTVAITEQDARRVATLRSPRIQLLQSPPKEPKR